MRARTQKHYTTTKTCQSLSLSHLHHAYLDIVSPVPQVRHDLPRPPSIVRDEFGESWIESYAGAEEGVQYIKASDWEPYIRTMPHSEFPSASACICQVTTCSTL